MTLLAALLRDIGFLAYGGPVLAWALLMWSQNRLHNVGFPSLIRSFRAWGPGFGLALGACVLGALGFRFLSQGTFYWGLNGTAARIDTATWVLFGCLWVSNIKLEIWTLDPLRKLDQNGQIEDMLQYQEAAIKLKNHLAAHGLLVVAVATCAVIRNHL